jgi:hypothetical protein
MTAGIEHGRFVHVVALVDPKKGTGQIRYVNPANSTLVVDAPVDPRVELVTLDAAGQELGKTPVVVRYGSCEEGESPTGLIQADLEKRDDMAAVSLRVDGQEVARYDAGSVAAAPPAAGLVMAAGPSPHKMAVGLSGAAATQPRAGVTYSVLVRPEGAEQWSTIAVGRPTPKVEIDRNQFAGARGATVKVLRTNGFDEQVVGEDWVDFSKP